MPAEHSGPEKKVRVCCFCERWASGGIESFLFNILTRIDLNGLQIDVVTSSLGESIFTQPLQQRGIQFHELSGSQKSVLENHRRFASLLRERRWNVIHLNIFHGLSLAYLDIARRGGVPVRIAHSHNTALRKSLTRPVKLAIHAWAKERFTRYATDLWACSQGAAEFLFSREALEQQDFQFIPNGIDTHRFCFDPAARKGIRTDLGLEDKFVVGNVGRLCYQKNQSFLLEIFAEILKRNPNSRLLLVGEGEDKALLLQKAQHLGIAEEVIFYGVTPHVEQMFWAMDVFILPSRFEGLPVTGVEAQTAGLPCFFSDVVTRECRISESTEFLSLAESPKQWAGVILGKSAAGDRAAAASAAQDAGFDVFQTARQVESGYRRSDVP